MRHLVKRLAAVAAIPVLAAGLAACGGGGNEGGGGGGKQGGSIRIGTVGPDSYDPALFQTVQANQALQLVYKGLVTYKDAEGAAGAEVVPGLAESLPDVSADGKTYRFKLRPNLEYSDGTPVKASDFEYTLKRLIVLGGPFSSFYSAIVGIDEFTKKKDIDGDISGITTNDKTGEITIKLTAPDGKLLYALGLANAAPLPPDKAPPRSLTKNPPPGVGPYTIEVVDPSREFILRKNPKFDIPGLAKGNVDKITGVVSDSVPRMTQDVISGKLDFMTEDPVGDLLPQVRARYKDRFREDPNPPNTYYFFMNVNIPPFDKLEARQAVNYALDSRALQRIFGGRLQPGCTFLPPSVPGYEKSDCPYGDPAGPPDLAKARELVKKAGVEGQKVTVWTNNKDPRPAIGDYLRDTLNSIGFKASVKTLDQQVYFATIGNEKTKAQIGFTDWYQDFPHPADFFEPLLTSKATESTPSFNEGFVRDKEIDAKVAELVKAKNPADVASQWAALDREVVGPEKAYVAPYGYELSSSFFSERMNFDDCSGVHPVYKNDWALFCLK